MPDKAISEPVLGWPQSTADGRFRFSPFIERFFDRFSPFFPFSDNFFVGSAAAFSCFGFCIPVENEWPSIPCLGSMTN
ncbi:MAG TPA: hypothetical protein VMJ32_09390 [Pirellulales bacterium]|nr:hypothetical protein [Pirellulales bacterium]